MADSMTYSQPVRRQIIQHLITTSMLIGGGVAGVLSLTTYFQRDSILRGLTSNAAIRDASAAIFPIVLVTQTLKGRSSRLPVSCEATRPVFEQWSFPTSRSGLAYPVNGIAMGGLDWLFSMFAMWAANLACVGLVRAHAANGTVTLGKIWWALAVFMGTQVVTGIFRFESKRGIWKVLRKQDN
jgi:hypothetical protein